jgi:hypothetical protein
MPQVDVNKLSNIESVNVIAKYIITKGADGISEFEFTKMLTGHAELNRRTGESIPAAFSRIFTDPENVELRKAYQITKGFNTMETTPTSVEVGSIAVADDSKAAYDALMKMAEAQHRLAPTLTIQQLFSRAFEANPELAAKAHQRPTPTTSYAFPR